MKKIFTIIAIAMGLMLPMQAQDTYVYKNTGATVKVDAEKIYFNTIEGEQYMTTEAEVTLDAIAGDYMVYSVSGISGANESWQTTITRDETDATKVWIQPICLFFGLSGDQINPIYATYDEKAATLSIPMGQCLYEDAEYKFVLGLADANNNYSPVTTGNVTATISATGITKIIEIADMIGVGNINNDEWWYQGVYNTAMVSDFNNSIIALNEIDSISTIAPQVGGEFVANGDYTWNFSYTEDGKNWEDLATVTTFTEKGIVDLGDVYGKEIAGIWAKKYRIGGFMAEYNFYDGGEASEIPAYSYTISYEDETIECLDLFDATGGFCCIGNAAFTDEQGDKLVLDMYLAELSENYLYPDLYFSVNGDAITYDGEQLVLFYQVDGNAYPLAYLSDVEISKTPTNQPLFARAKVEMLKDAFKLGNAQPLVKMGARKSRIAK